MFRHWRKLIQILIYTSLISPHHMRPAVLVDRELVLLILVFENFRVCQH